MYPLFASGQIVATPGALDLLERSGHSPGALLRRHLTGDWGDLCADDKARNDAALEEGFRLHSAYSLGSAGEKIWVITEADRSVTTLLLPGEY